MTPLPDPTSPSRSGSRAPTTSSQTSVVVRSVAPGRPPGRDHFLGQGHGDRADPVHQGRGVQLRARRAVAGRPALPQGADGIRRFVAARAVLGEGHHQVREEPAHPSGDGVRKSQFVHVSNSLSARPSANRALTPVCDPEAAVSVRPGGSRWPAARDFAVRPNRRNDPACVGPWPPLADHVTRNGCSTTACQVVLSRSWLVLRLVPRFTVGVVTAPDPGGRPIVPA